MNTRSVDSPQEGREFMMKCLIADRAANLPRLRKVLEFHAAVRTRDMRCVLLSGALLLIAAEDSLQEVLRRNILLLRAEN